MKALVDPHGCDELPAVKKWLEHAEATRRLSSASVGQFELLGS
jgi:hypothetical protein